MCIGNRLAMLEMKSALAKLVRRFTLTLDTTKPVVPVADVTLGVDSKSGMHVMLHERHS